MYWLHRLNPANKFKEHFELAEALTPELKDEVYRLRHRVYFDELGFERPSFDGRERDEFDEHSRHLLLRSVKTGIPAGCIRLVMARPDRPHLPLPFEKIFAAAGDLGDRRPAPPRHSIAEISRLTLAREFRRRRGDARNEISHEGFGTPAHPSHPYVQLGLYLGAIALARRLDVSRLYLLTEPRLLTHFKRLGFPLQKIGGPIDRAPRIARVVDGGYRGSRSTTSLLHARVVQGDRARACRRRSTADASSRSHPGSGPFHRSDRVRACGRTALAAATASRKRGSRRATVAPWSGRRDARRSVAQGLSAKPTPRR